MTHWQRDCGSRKGAAPLGHRTPQQRHDTSLYVGNIKSDKKDGRPKPEGSVTELPAVVLHRVTHTTAFWELNSVKTGRMLKECRLRVSFGGEWALCPYMSSWFVWSWQNSCPSLWSLKLAVNRERRGTEGLQALPSCCHWCTRVLLMSSLDCSLSWLVTWVGKELLCNCTGHFPSKVTWRYTQSFKAPSDVSKECLCLPLLVKNPCNSSLLCPQNIFAT